MEIEMEEENENEKEKEELFLKNRFSVLFIEPPKVGANLPVFSAIFTNFYIKLAWQTQKLALWWSSCRRSSNYHYRYHFSFLVLAGKFWKSFSSTGKIIFSLQEQ